MHPGCVPPAHYRNGGRSPWQRPPWTETPVWTDTLWKHNLRKLRLQAVIIRIKIHLPDPPVEYGCFNPKKVLENWDLGLSNHTIKSYVCWSMWKMLKIIFDIFDML